MPQNAAEIERAIASFASGKPNGGLVLPPNATTSVSCDLIITLANQYRLPAVYSFRLFVKAGGLMSYGVDFVHQNWQAASYVDRILRGEKPSYLPVQAPTKYETAVNLKTAKSLDSTLPPDPLVAADEVIEYPFLPSAVCRLFALFEHALQCPKVFRAFMPERGLAVRQGIRSPLRYFLVLGSSAGLT